MLRESLRISIALEYTRSDCTDGDKETYGNLLKIIILCSQKLENVHQTDRNALTSYSVVNGAMTEATRGANLAKA